MKRAILVAAMAVAATSAFAQNNVTIYGVADAAYQYGSGKNTTFSGIQSGGWSGSRIGFTGSEELGNGLKGIFTLEFGTDLDTGAGLTQARQSFVGVDSVYGTVTAGRQYSPSGAMMGKNSAFEITGATPMSQFTGSTSYGTMGTGDKSRWNNSIAYQSKTYNGFTGRAVYAFGEKDVTKATNNDSSLGFGVSYANGPYNADVIYQTLTNVNQTEGDVREWYFGGGYDFQVVKVVGSYQTLSSDRVVNAGTDSKTWSLGAIVPVSAVGKVRAEYARTSFSDSAVNGSSRGWAIGYTHDLSKRTMLYTSYTHISNDANSLGFGANGVGAAGESNHTVVAGLKHSF